jgi:hypothetical protein
MARLALNLFSTKPSPATSDAAGAGLAIRQALDKVQGLRAQWQDDPQRLLGVQWIKSFQTRRFACQYQDFLASPRYGATAHFFLHRLYGQEQPQQRDAQFARIANAIAKVFPEQVVHTAVQVSQLHALTETLDDAMGHALSEAYGTDLPPQGSTNNEDAIQTYTKAWRSVGRSGERHTQLQQVIQLGQTMGTLAKVRGLGLSLRMMRGPAQLAQLGELQNWLEEGFYTFYELDRQAGATAEFLAEIEGRESALIAALFASNPDTGRLALQQVLKPVAA